MKYTEKMQLLFKGVSLEDIKALEAQEAQELAEADQSTPDQSDQTDPDPSDQTDQTDYKELFDNAESLIKEMETKLQQNQDELSKLKNEIAAFNNRQTQQASQPEKYDEVAVFKELFNNKQ